jgi:hypothetical protein
MHDTSAALDLLNCGILWIAAFLKHARKKLRPPAKAQFASASGR